MNVRNVEIKARCEDADLIRSILETHNAEFKGTDHQIDTYFNIPDGRLKLRQGTIEENLIFYRRPDAKTPETSDINLVPAEHPEQLHALLDNALGTKVVVDKKREIYFIDNVKFHIDRVEKLGRFVEIEAIDEDNSLGQKKLHEQCQKYLDILGIEEEDLIAESYSDMLIN